MLFRSVKKEKPKANNFKKAKGFYFSKLNRTTRDIRKGAKHFAPYFLISLPLKSSVYGLHHQILHTTSDRPSVQTR